MSIRARCSGCDKGYAVEERHAGRTLRCKACGGRVEVPTVGAAATAAVASQAKVPVKPVGTAPSRTSGGAARPAQAAPKQRPRPAASDDPFGNMDALLSLEAGGTVREEEPVAVAPPPPLPKGNRAAAAAATPAVPLGYASRPTGPRRDPNWRPPGSQPAGFGSLLVSRILPIGGGVLALLFVLGLAVDALKTPVILLLGLVGMLMMLTGAIGCLVCACRESSVCALLYLFVPMYSIYYILTRLEDTKVYVLTWLGGIACMIGVVTLIPKDGRRAEIEAPARAGRVAVVVAADGCGVA